ncbi:AAC(3) family N-acetyltransferase [Pseudomonas mucidolens]|uniref:Aminoglycoside N(3)-acetyltransferase n=1 Tax=Pseudomonas mucidolens TaxID=46679 RepID=A0A1H2N1S0_9PSED|nr:AAC(3) family N-acetyltransferase [Pseudomonas mucidolens]SDU99322.1 aminoglycoside 3-N-acetyltransferase [Pseudomonas mucidolens]SQH32808.1 aminoglycoside 3-n-acetyltransferase [Pseudomonas mucidolens]
MANTGLVKKIFALSPHIEMLGRRVYWRNVQRLAGKVKKSAKKKRPTETEQTKPFDYLALDRYLKDCGARAGSLMVVHSAFAPFKGRVSGPDEMVEFLLGVVGASGTLAMPAMPMFSNSRSVEEYLSTKPDDKVYVYNVQKSRIKTGVLPGALHKRAGSVRSRHPINTMVASGKLAEVLMDGNLTGNSPLACGVNSSWSRCVEHDALIVGLGTDLTHSLTMIHVAEDVKDAEWPVSDWYVEKHFLIKDGDFEESRVLRERAPRWGALHFGERTLCKDLLAAGLLKTAVIDGVVVEVLSAKALIAFLDARNHSGYPYFWVGS